jgi:hypothetical protein
VYRLKLKIVLISFIILSLFASPTANAERLKGKGVSQLYLSINFEYPPSAVRCENGMIVELTGLELCDYPNNYVKDNGSNFYWYKAGLLGMPHALGVQGVYLKLTNPTNKVMIIKWSESSFSIGTFSGTPFLSGMKYKDAGNPSATPDSIIPPQKALSTALFISQVSFEGGNWNQGYAYVRADKSLKASIYMKVLDPDGKATYNSVESPPIILPETALNGITIEK